MAVLEDFYEASVPATVVPSDSPSNQPPISRPRIPLHSMTTNGTLHPLPNPYTPLAFLPPTMGAQFEASIYLFVASLSAFTCDWLLSLPEEIKMCRRARLRPGIVAYFLSRIGTFGYCLVIVVFHTTSVGRCDVLVITIGSCFILAVPSTSALVVLRARDVYSGNKILTIFFGVLLFALFAICFLVLPAVKGAHIGTTHRCINIAVASYASAPVILNTVIDTLVFVAISLRVISFSLVGETFGARMKSFLRGDGLPSLSRSLLQGGQMYYFTTIGFNIVVVTMVIAPVPPVSRAIISIPGTALGSAMACRVCRGIMLGSIQDDLGSRTTANTTLRFARQSHHSDVPDIHIRLTSP